MVRRLRYELYAAVMRFPLRHFKRTSAGEIIPMVTAETDPIGGFIGESIASPAFQAGLLVTYMTFIFMQNFWLGLAAVALYPPQAYLIPKLQRKINQLAKRRIQTTREFSDRIGDVIGGAADIRANNAARYELADASARLGTIYGIRVDIYKRKFFVKFLNNFLAQITPFFFYAIGGYFAIQGQLSRRRAGRGGRRVQGHHRSVEGAAQVVRDEGGRARQVRADRLAVRAGGHSARRRCSRTRPRRCPGSPGRWSRTT